MSDFIFKLTPNNRQVVINSDVLINGYKDVTYPILFKDSAVLGYVLDPDTFKFIDNADFIQDNRPYPVNMKISLVLKNAPFYGRNDKYSTNKIVVNSPKKEEGNFLSDNLWTVEVNEKNVQYDRFTIDVPSNTDSDYSYVGYTVVVDIYWSDNLSHIPEYLKDNSLSNQILNTYPLSIKINGTFLQDGCAGYNYSSTPDHIITDPSADPNNFSLYLCSMNNCPYYDKKIFTIPDSFDQFDKDVATVYVSATFIDPLTYRTVFATTKDTLKQDPYPGQKKGYLKIGFVDTVPVDVWSPTLTYINAKSKNDEANVKVDKKSYTEYYAFLIHGYINIDQKFYEQLVCDEYCPGVVTSKNVSIFNNHLIEEQNREPVTQDEIDASYLKNCFDYNNIVFTYFCSDKYYTQEPGAKKYYDSSVFSNADVAAFEQSYANNMIHNWGVSVNVSELLKNDDIFIEDNLNTAFKGITTVYPKPNNYKLQSPENDDFNNLKDVSLILPDVSGNLENASTKNEDNYAFGCILASYPYYTIINGAYQQLCCVKDNEVVVFDSTDDINFQAYKNTSTSTVNNGIELPYKVITDSLGNSIQYKYCVNQIDVQIPRYGLYPHYTGFMEIPYTVYDYENPDFVPAYDFDNMIKKGYAGNKEIMTRSDVKSGSIKINDDDLLAIQKWIVKSKTDDTSADIDNIIQAASKSSSFSSTSRKLGARAIYGAETINYGASNDYSIVVSGADEIQDYITINGVHLSELKDGTMTSSVNPGIFVIALDENYPKNYSGVISISGSVTGTLLITNDENEKHLRHYDNNGHDIGNSHSSAMLLRANPKLSGNVKLVVDSTYNLYLDTFKASPVLNQHKFRKYPISSEGNYPRDIKNVFKSLPSNELFAIPSNSLNSHKVYNDFNDQYETMYEYGAETNKDNLYSENMKILAPLHIGNDVPEYFAIFRYDSALEQKTFDNVYTTDTDKFIELIKNSDIVKTYDLRCQTSIGQYLNNYHKMLSNYGQCYLQFIEQDYDKNSKAYRQGTNIWKGISVKRGILTDQSETTYFGSKILNSDISNKQERFNAFIQQGFERNNLLYPNIINLEFMFNDPDIKEYSMNRYFGLYLTANDFIKYRYILPKEGDINNNYIKLDNTGSIYKGDTDILNTIFSSEYSNRIFYATTINDAMRIKNNNDLDNFINHKVKNKPYRNLVSLESSETSFDEKDKSFITLHFSKPLKYGEHLKFIAMNYIQKNATYTNIGSNYKESSNDATSVETSELPYEHIVYEIIASNDIRLKDADNYINPYITTNKCRYSENTYFNRITFYSQDIDYPEIPATIEEQIKRIIACILKFDSFIKVSSHNSNSIAFISEHDEMYLQHIASHDFDDFKYDYMKFTAFNNDIKTTNNKYTNSIDFMTTANVINETELYEQINDEEHDWIKGSNVLGNEEWQCYVEAEDPRNIITDNISYFNATYEYKMHALSNQSDYYDGYYAAFSNYCFESLGWRYNTVIQFQKIKKSIYYYTVHSNINNIIKEVKYPLIYNVNNMYDTLNIFKISSGYLRNNIIDPDFYESYTSMQKFIFNTDMISVITSPYDVNYSMIASNNEALLDNNEVHLYEPMQANIAIMGISNIKDIDTVVDAYRTLHVETNLNICVDAKTTISVDETDKRIQHGVMYEIVSGELYTNSDIKINIGTKFIIIPQNERYCIYIEGKGNNKSNITSLYSDTYTVYKICDRQYYQNYNYDTKLPTLSTDNYHKDNPDKDPSDLLYSIVPTVNCNWKSNGTYYDFNNTLNVDMLKFDYEPIGNFTENVYNASKFISNQYVSNRIDNILYVDGKVMTYKESILNKATQHSIKKLLIDDVNIETASAYYNANIQSLEFIFYGIKFNIKLNSKIVNSFIHLDEYTGFEVFVLNDYDMSKRNELYVSLAEKFILLINHQFYIEYAREAANNIKVIGNKFVPYAPYAAYSAPYCIDFASSGYNGIGFTAYKISDTDNVHKNLLQSIDKHNLWSSLFVQYDTPTVIQNREDNKPQFIQSFIETTSEYNDFVTFGNTYSTDWNYKIGIFNDNYNVYSPTNKIDTKSISSDSNAFIVTKADGEYNHQAQTLLKSINDKLNTIYNAAQRRAAMSLNENDDKNNKQNVSEVEVQYTDYLSKDITINEEVLKTRVENDYANKTLILDMLSKLLDSNVFRVIMNPFNDVTKNFTTVTIPLKWLNEVKQYIGKTIALETHKERLQRYCKSIDNNIDIYIIPEDTNVKFIKNTSTYNPLLFNLTVPTHVKYNYGWFTPNTNEIVHFDINDPLQDLLNVDLLLCNTKITGIEPLINYTGNKVLGDTQLTELTKNYFVLPEKSLLSTTQDYGYYRLYKSETDYELKPGFETGIDDKSFFGSKCMALRNNYIQLDTWQFNTANDLYSISFVNSEYNVNDKATKSIKIEINLSSIIQNHFINNKAFYENWNKFDNTQVTGIKNYVTNIISTYYNMNSDIDIKLYAINTNSLEPINILNEKPADFNIYYVYENYSSNISYSNGIYTLTIILNESNGKNIYPIVKIYRK